MIGDGSHTDLFVPSQVLEMFTADLFVPSQVLEMFTADFPKSSWDVAARYGGTAGTTALYGWAVNHASRLSLPLLFDFRDGLVLRCTCSGVYNYVLVSLLQVQWVSLPSNVKVKFILSWF